MSSLEKVIKYLRKTSMYIFIPNYKPHLFPQDIDTILEDSFVFQLAPFSALTLISQRETRGKVAPPSLQIYSPGETCINSPKTSSLACKQSKIIGRLQSRAFNHEQIKRARLARHGRSTGYTHIREAVIH